MTDYRPGINTGDAVPRRPLGDSAGLPGRIEPGTAPTDNLGATLRYSPMVVPAFVKVVEPIRVIERRRPKAEGDRQPDEIRADPAGPDKEFP